MRVKQTAPKVFLLTLAILLVIPMSYGAAAEPPFPTRDTASVDCDASEWNLAEDGTGDFFSDMWRAANPGTVLESKLYMRYECRYDASGTALDAIAYALVLAQPGVPIAVDGDFGGSPVNPTMAHIKLKGSDYGNGDIVNGNDNNPTCEPLPDTTQPQFTWIGLDTQDVDGDGVDEQIATGWEASFFVAPDYYTGFEVHTQVYDDGGSQTSDVPDRAIALNIYCPPQLTAVDLASFEAKSGNQAIALHWETASELDNLGFNLYRAESADGPWTQLNADLIPSQVPPGSPVGPAYSFTDQDVWGGTAYYYRLETIDVQGQPTLHGPVHGALKAFKLNPLRPRLRIN